MSSQGSFQLLMPQLLSSMCIDQSVDYIFRPSFCFSFYNFTVLQHTKLCLSCMFSLFLFVFMQKGYCFESQLPSGRLTVCLLVFFGYMFDLVEVFHVMKGKVLHFSFGDTVSSHKEIDRSEGSFVQVDMNQFFGEDGKIYGYKGLKVIYFLFVRQAGAFLFKITCKCFSYYRWRLFVLASGEATGASLFKLISNLCLYLYMYYIISITSLLQSIFYLIQIIKVNSRRRR